MTSCLATTTTPQERAKAARSTEDDVHKAWHRIFGDCRRERCPERKEEPKC